MPLDLASVPQLARNIHRVAEIVRILARYGLADWVARLDRRFLYRLLKDTRVEPLTAVSHEARVRLAFTDLGTTFIKLGQMLSTRRDLVGPALAAELTHLQSEVPADPFPVARATVEAELGRPLAELFADFAEQPVASASIGQAHRATLPDGRAVVVKVQHPDIAARVQTDLAILAELARLAEEYLADLRPYRPVALVEEFQRVLLRELDFRREFRHLEIFNRNFADDPEVRFPVPYREWSTAKVLTMSYLEGTPLTRVASGLPDGVGSDELARRGTRVFLDMVFRDAFYHADPHPGNVLMLAGGVIGLLDAGMVGRVDDRLRGQIETAMIAVMEGNAAALTDLVMRVGEVPPHFDPGPLQAEIADQLAFYWGMPLDQFQLGTALEELTDAIRRYHVRLPPPAALLLKVMVMLEGTARLLSPTFNLAEVLGPYHKQFARRRLSPRRLARQYLATAQDLDEVLRGLPRLARDLMQAARRQQFAVTLAHRHLDPAANRLTFGMMTSSLFVGSSLLWAYAAPPTVMGVSVPGLTGCAAACVLGYRLYVAIRRSGRLDEE